VFDAGDQRVDDRFGRGEVHVRDPHRNGGVWAEETPGTDMGVRVRLGLDGFPFGGICASAVSDFVEVGFHGRYYTITPRFSCQPPRIRLYSADCVYLNVKRKKMKP
jgi:hypothetical protein